MSYAILRLPKKLDMPGGTSAITMPQAGAPNGSKITPGDVGDAITAILVMDDVAARADAAAAEAGAEPPRVPRCPARVTVSVCNDAEAPPAKGEIIKPHDTP